MIEHETSFIAIPPEPHPIKDWLFFYNHQLMKPIFDHDDGMWGNNHFRFFTRHDEDGGHNIGVHKILPNAYTPVHIIPSGNRDIQFMTLAGSGRLIALSEQDGKEQVLNIPLTPGSERIKLEASDVTYCLFSDEKGLTIAYVATPLYGLPREEIVSPGGYFDGPEGFWGALNAEVKKRPHKSDNMKEQA